MAIRKAVLNWQPGKPCLYFLAWLIETIRNHIFTGLPDRTVSLVLSQSLYPPSEILTGIKTHLMWLPSPFNRQFACYFTILSQFFTKQDLRTLDCSCPIYRASGTVPSGDKSPNCKSETLPANGTGGTEALRAQLRKSYQRKKKRVYE